MLCSELHQLKSPPTADTNLLNYRNLRGQAKDKKITDMKSHPIIGGHLHRPFWKCLRNKIGMGRSCHNFPYFQIMLGCSQKTSLHSSAINS